MRSPAIAWAQADTEASQAVSRDEIQAIYDRAGKDINDYITGTDANGNPNIRHYEHQNVLRDSMRGLDEVTKGRAWQAQQAFDARQTKAQAQYLMDEAIENGDAQGMMDAVDLFPGLTSEERTGLVKKGEREIEVFRGKAEYDAFNAEAQALQEMNYLGEFDDTTQYLDSLLELRGRVSESDMGDGRKSAALTTINGRIHRERSRANNALRKASIYVADKMVTNDLEQEGLISLRRDLGETAYNALVKARYTDVKEAATAGNEKAKEAMDYFSRMVDGKDSWGKTVENLSLLTSAYGDIMIAAANLYMGEVVESQSTTVAYDSLWKEIPVSVDGDFKDFVGTLRYYANTTTDAGGYISKQMKAYMKWKTKGDADESYEDFKTKTFGADAKREAALIPSQFIIGTEQPESATPTISTQEELDALPVGAIYIDSEDGKTYRK
jgi:hypothetical protein